MAFLESYVLFGVPLIEWIPPLIIMATAYLILATGWRFMVRKLTAHALKTAHLWDDIFLEVLRSTHQLTLALFAILIGMQFMALSDKWQTRLDHITFIIIGIQIGAWVSRGISLWAAGKLSLSKNSESTESSLIMTGMLSWIFKATAWSIVLLTILANLGVNITAFVASLGIGGVAVALAVQNILSDLFASLAIGLDKPFVIGDFIVFGDVAGSIERVGLKTTHIRSISGEQIVCSNTDLLKNTIHNYKRMAERRVVFTFGIPHGTDVDAIEKIPGIIKQVIEKQKNTRFDRAHFKAFGDSSLDFEVVYFINSSDFNLYMDIQQAINLAIMREFKAIDVAFAHPMMTLNLPQTLTPEKETSRIGLH